MSEIHIPRWLTSDAPGWEIESDVIVIDQGLRVFRLQFMRGQLGEKL